MANAEMSWEDCAAALRAGADPAELMPRVSRMGRFLRRQREERKLDEVKPESTLSVADNLTQTIGLDDAAVDVPMELIRPPMVVIDQLSDERGDPYPLDGELDFDLPSLFKPRYVRALKNGRIPSRKRPRDESSHSSTVREESNVPASVLYAELKTAMDKRSVLSSEMTAAIANLTEKDCVLLLANAARDGLTEPIPLTAMIRLCASKIVSDQAIKLVLPSLVCIDYPEVGSSLPPDLIVLLGVLHQNSSLPGQTSAEFKSSLQTLGLSKLGVRGVLAEVELTLAQTQISLY